jgi:hypothetical protein
MTREPVGLWVIVIGVLLVVVGAAIYFGAFRWFGRLPGDFKFEGEHTKIYFPFVSMLLLSLLMSALMYFFRR